MRLSWRLQLYMPRGLLRRQLRASSFKFRLRDLGILVLDSLQSIDLEKMISIVSRARGCYLIALFPVVAES